MVAPAATFFSLFVAACGASDGAPLGAAGAANENDAGSGRIDLTRDASTSEGGSIGCDGGRPSLTGLVRDFKPWNDGDGHPDFWHYPIQGQKKMVLPELGSDKKPVYNPDPDPPALVSGNPPPLVNGKHASITSPDSFASWFRDTPGINQTFVYDLPLEKSADGKTWSFSTNEFFPIDGKGFGNDCCQDLGIDHNFDFTFELHTEFKYNGGEVFTFSGDDDVWVFINGRLAVDLGGTHSPQQASVDLDAQRNALGIAIGGTYTLDAFQAERHPDGSNFRIDTTIEFTNCDPIIVR